MSKYAVIVQNDESEWDDITGELYHFPRVYKDILQSGCRVIYYKGKMTDIRYAVERLSSAPHYFGVGTVGGVVLDPESTKGNRFAEVLDFQEFGGAVLAKQDGTYLEEIPEARKATIGGGQYDRLRRRYSNEFWPMRS